MEAIDFLSNHYFIKYLKNLYGIIFDTKKYFKFVYNNKNNKISDAVLFFVFSIISSLPFLFLLLVGLGGFSYKYEWLMYLIFFNVFVLTTVIPLESLYLHIFFRFLLKGTGNMYDTVVLVLYSYAVVPFVTFIAFIFTFIYWRLGYPISFLPTGDNGLLSILEYSLNTLIIMFSIYLLSAGANIAHNISRNKAVFVIILASILLYLIVYFFVVLLLTKFPWFF